MKKSYLIVALILLNPVLLFSQWTKINACSNWEVDDIACQGNIIIVGCSDGFVISTDKGDTWTSDESMLNIRAVAFIDKYIVKGEGGFRKGIFLSSDSGRTWINKNFGSNENVYVLKAVDDKLYVGTDESIYLSTDLGDSWSNIGNGLNMYISTIAVNEDDIYTANFDFGAIYHSTNGGNIWDYKDILETICGVTDIVTDGENLLAGTNGGGIFISSDKGDNWKKLNNGLTDKDVKKLAIYGQNIFAGTEGGVFLSTNYGNDWRPINSGLQDLHVLSLAANDSDIFVGTYNKALFRAKLSSFGLTDIDDINNNSGVLNIFPNPVFDNITILNDKPIISITIYDILGNEVTTLNDLNQNRINISVKELPLGMYYCSINSGSKKITKSFSVIK